MFPTWYSRRRAIIKSQRTEIKLQTEEPLKNWEVDHPNKSMKPRILKMIQKWWSWSLLALSGRRCTKLMFFFSSVQFSRSVVSNSLRPHELQHTRPPCPSPTPKFTQTYVHRVGDAIQTSHPLSSPSPSAPNPSQHQSLFQWVNSLHEVAKVLEFQL